MTVESFDKLSIINALKKIRIIPHQQFSGEENMCIDLYLAQIVEASQIPILRFYSWVPYCLSLGHNQSSLDVNFDSIKSARIDVVKRPTGGSAILHAEELTYSFIIPKKNISHHSSYTFFHIILAKALKNLGY